MRRSRHAASLALALVVAAGFGCGRRPNVIVINVDMLRADHLGVYGYQRDTTPTLDRLAREGVWFRNARSQSSWTYPSVVSLLSGLEPTSHGAGYSREGDRYVTTVLPDTLETLPNLLRAHGYRTAAFVTNPLLKRSSGLAHGFDVYRDEFVGEWRRDTNSAWWLEAMAAENVNRAVLAWFDDEDDAPRFVYLHYIDVHGPYLTPRPFGRPPGSVSPRVAEYARVSGRLPEVMVDVYDGALRYLDTQIDTLLAELDRRGVLQRSIVIVTADHGEEFHDHGGFGHGHTLYEELLHVPLIMVRTEAFPHTGSVETPVAQVDLVPTIADLVGVDAPRGAGTSLRPLIEGGTLPARPLLSEMDNRGRPRWNAPPDAYEVVYAMLLPPAFKYIRSARVPGVPAAPGGDEREELYDLSRDPGERHDLAPAGGPETAAAREALRTAVAAAEAQAVTPGRAPIDAETQERLRVLGYAE